MGRGRRLAEEGGVGGRNGDWRATILGGGGEAAGERGGERQLACLGGRGRWTTRGIAKCEDTTDIEPFDLAHMSRRHELYVVVLTASS